MKKRKVIKLTEEVENLLKKVKGKPTCTYGEGMIPLEFDNKVCDAYRDIIRKLAPKKWEPSVINNVPVDLIDTLLEVITFFSYGELGNAGTEVYFTIEH